MQHQSFSADYISLPTTTQDSLDFPTVRAQEVHDLDYVPDDEVPMSRITMIIWTMAVLYAILAWSSSKYRAQIVEKHAVEADIVEGSTTVEIGDFFEAAYWVFCVGFFIAPFIISGLDALGWRAPEDGISRKDKNMVAELWKRLTVRR